MYLFFLLYFPKPLSSNTVKCLNTGEHDVTCLPVSQALTVVCICYAGQFPRNEL